MVRPFFAESPLPQSEQALYGTGVEGNIELAAVCLGYVFLCLSSIMLFQRRTLQNLQVLNNTMSLTTFLGSSHVPCFPPKMHLKTQNWEAPSAQRTIMESGCKQTALLPLHMHL